MRALLIAMMLLVVGCAPRTSVSTDAEPVSKKVYGVKFVPDAAITVDGVLDEADWKKAILDNSFCFPWRDKDVPRTDFRALSNGKTLYFCFSVDDTDIVAKEKFDKEKDMIGQDRCELYFAPDDMKSPYYSVEMDFRGNKMDYKATFHRKFDFSWDCPAGLKTAGSRGEKGYIVEGAIPLKTLESLGLPSLESGELRVGIYRAEFDHGEGESPVENWISWVNPNKVEEDFHVPYTLGIFRLEKESK